MMSSDKMQRLFENQTLEFIYISVEYFKSECTGRANVNRFKIGALRLVPILQLGLF